MTTTPVEIIFAGSAVTARILYGYLQTDARYRAIGCVVDDAYADNSSVPLPVIGISAVTGKYPPQSTRVIMALGYDQVNAVRKSMFERLRNLGYAIESYVHPKALWYSQNAPGEGCVIMPGALIEPGASVGMDTFIWGNVVVAHDAEVGDHCWLAAGAVISGMAKVEERCFVGVNATIANKMVCGAASIIGGAAFISKNIRPDSVFLARSAEPFRCTATEYARYFGL